MGVSCHKNLSILLITVCLVLLLNIKTLVQSSDGNIANEICPKASNPAFCFQVLGHLGSVSLSDQCLESIHKAQVACILAADVAHVLIIDGQNPALNDKFKSCIQSYQQTILGLSRVERLLKAGKYHSMPAEASATLTEAGACNRLFQPPESEPAELKRGTKTLEDECSTVLNNSNLLARRAV